MDKTLANDPSVFPDEATKANSYVVRPKPPETVKLQTQLWLALKAKR